MNLLSSIIIFFFCTSAFAFTEDNTIKRVEYKYVPQYQGQKDRYDEQLLRNDPEVLVSAPKKKQKIKYVVIHAKPRKEKPVTVTYSYSEE